MTVAMIRAICELLTKVGMSDSQKLTITQWRNAPYVTASFFHDGKFYKYDVYPDGKTEAAEGYQLV